MYVSPPLPCTPLPQPNQTNQPNQPVTIIQSATDETLLGRILILILKGRKRKKERKERKKDAARAGGFNTYWTDAGYQIESRVL